MRDKRINCIFLNSTKQFKVLNMDEVGEGDVCKQLRTNRIFELSELGLLRSHLLGYKILLAV